jgi:putative component of toxin-antitoxin plasmid stabilization module
MIEVVQSSEFRDWLSSLRDRQVRARIIGRITRMEAGKP